MTASPPDPRPLRAYRYSAGAIVIHWLTVAAILVQLVLAWRMQGARSPETFAAFQLHKSVGVTILVLTLLRIGWRLANRPPAMPETLAAWERWLARITHTGFYLLLIALPLTGWLVVSTSPLRIPTLLYGAIPWPDIPGLAGLSGPAREAWREVGEVGHVSLALLLLGLLALHVAGALKHQFFDREAPVLGRMLPGAWPGRWLEPRLLGVVVALAAIGVAAATMKPPLSRARPPAAPPAETQELAAAPAPAPAPVARIAAVAPAAPQAKEAADATPASPPAANPDPVRWRVQPGSTLGFETSWGGEPIRGSFGQWDADILFSPQALDRSRVKVEITMSSVQSGDAQRDSSLPGEDWFAAASHAKATFTADRFEQTGPERYVAHGRLTLRGTTQPLDLPFRLKIDGDTARVSGVTSLDRTAFGVGQGEWKSTDQIPGKVTVRVDLRARSN